jgi:hypothetical protein
MISRFNIYSFGLIFKKQINFTEKYDEEGIRTLAGKAHWISSPTP